MLRFDGHIMGAAFASGHRIVAGRWFDSPFGGFADVMWRDAAGRRLLLASSPEAAGFIEDQYAFDEVRVGPVSIQRTGERIEISAGELRLGLRLHRRGLPSHLLGLQPARLRTLPGWIRAQDVLARPVLGPLLFGGGRTRLTGTTRAGVREWYAIHDFRRASASADAGARDLGPVGACSPAGFGFSEFPDGAAMVRVTSMFAGQGGEK